MDGLKTSHAAQTVTYRNILSSILLQIPLQGAHTLLTIPPLFALFRSTPMKGIRLSSFTLEPQLVSSKSGTPFGCEPD